MTKYVEEVTKLAVDLREATEKENKLINDGTYLLASNPKEIFVIPAQKENVPYFNFAPMENALAELNEQATAFAEVSKNYMDNPQSPERLNAILKNMERSLTREEGLPRRPWFKHHIYAPGFYTGYGVKTLPGVREAIEQRDFDQVNQQIEILGEVLLQFSSYIEEALSIMR